MNSIEEDITKIEGLKYLTLQATINEKFICAKIPDDYIEAIEHILSDYKRALKENEELKNQEATQRKINELLVQRYSNSIPVQKVKDLKNRILENEEYTVVLEGDKEFPDSTTEATFEKYINLKVLDELVERK